MDIETISVINPDLCNIIFGQSHFVKTVEDIHEALVSTVPGIKFGLAFCEASGSRLIRTTGTSEDMVSLALKNAKKVGAGHTFFLFLDNAFPINVLPAIRQVAEVVTIFCATANPVEVIIAKTGQGRGVLGVIDGGAPLGVENEEDKKKRTQFLRSIGYKLS